MREIKIGPPDAPLVMSIEIRGDDAKAEALRQVVLSALREFEKREPQPCHGCGDR